MRVLLDTNVWRYLSDCNAIDELARAAKSSDTKILVAPSTIYEALRTRDENLRQRLTKAMTDPRWKRLMPEAYSETRELLREIHRVRPYWLRDKPDRGLFMRLKHDWSNTKNGFWARAFREPTLEAQRLHLLGDGTSLDKARDQSENRRRELRNSDWKEPPPLHTTRARFPAPVAGWRNDDLEPWRLDGWTTTTQHLSTDTGAYFDWLHGDVALAKLRSNRTTWLEFWLYEIEAQHMPIFWVRWAFEFLQGFRRVTDGTPCDSQLAAYFPESDVFCSADGALIWMLDRCAPEAPCAMPRSLHVAGGQPGVEQLLEFIKARQ